MEKEKNVIGTELKVCSMNPLTGFFRNGCCDTDNTDQGMHTVCIKVTSEFLAFSKAAGNDLSTPMPEYHFQGLKDGDQWCLCAPRWVEAYQNQAAPKVFLESTHIETLMMIPLELLKEYDANK